MRTYSDRWALLERRTRRTADLLGYDEVWAAAGTWTDVFGIAPSRLVEASGGVLTDLART